MKLQLVALFACLGGCAAGPVHATSAEACSTPGAGPASAVAASDSPRRRIYLVRHGEANYLGADGHPLADPDAAGLSGKGREQAHAAAQWFCAMGVRRFDHVISSDFPRAAQTARAILDDMNLPSVQAQGWPQLRELRLADSTHAGESLTEARARILPAFEKLRGEDWNTALIVAHTLVDDVILSEVLTGSSAAYGRIEQGNGCINILDVGPGSTAWVVRAVNVCPDPALYWTRQSLADRLKH